MQPSRNDPSAPPRGRGAAGNPANRFERREVEPFDDGWTRDDEPAPAVETVVIPEITKRAITTNASPDVGMERTINPYKGCEHGCAYCFARPTHSYLGLSPGLDFETKIFSKPDAPALLRKELSRPGYVPKTIVMGANTDAYQPAERKLGLSRAILEVLAEFKHPVGVLTKSALVLRDADLLSAMAKEGLAAVSLSITTLDRSLARTMEPRAAAPERRLDALRGLSEAGVPVGVLAAPMIPGLNDHELERILEAAKQAGARRAGYVLLRLPHELKGLFTDWLERSYPGKAKRVLALLRATRDGALYDSGWFTRQRGRGPLADLLSRRFDLACRRLGLSTDYEPLDATRFRVPFRPSAGAQGTLF
jgi:DNA repair photolyase